VTLGFGQRNIETLKNVVSQQIPWIRRPTGGGAVHHRNDLIFSIILPIASHPVFKTARDAYRAIHGGIREALLSFGFETELHGSDSSVRSDINDMNCFERPVCHDLMRSGEKIVGGAQRRSKGYLLHQGSIQESVLRSAFAQKKISADQLVRAAFKRWSEAWEFEERVSRVQPEELELAHQLKLSRYFEDDWNFRGLRERSVNEWLEPSMSGGRV